MCYVILLSASRIYGVDRWLEDVKVMLGDYPWPRLYWKLLWKYFTPALILVRTFSNT